MILQVNLSQSCPDILSQAMQCELSEQLNSQLGKASDPAFWGPSESHHLMAFQELLKVRKLNAK